MSIGMGVAARPLEWIESAGGPLLFAPRSALVYWYGNTSPTLGATTDYQRACAITGEMEAISIGPAQALVLGDEPDRSALIARSPASVLVLRWRWAQSEESLLSALDLEQIAQLPSTAEKVFTAVGDQYLLFDSAYRGVDFPHALQAELKAGPCFFDTLDFRPNADTCVLIHRLRVQDRYARHVSHVCNPEVR